MPLVSSACKREVRLVLAVTTMTGVAPPSTQPLQDFDAVKLGEREIEDYQCVFGDLQSVVGFGPVVSDMTV